MSRQSTIWHGCYGGSWNGIITPDAFAHPAKFAPGLIQRIYQHMLERGYLAAGDSVVDPFGGIAAGGYHAMLNGLHWTGVELEPRFVALGNANIDKWQHDLRMLNGRLGTARLMQGDSRMLAAIVGAAGGVVSSPPYDSGTVHSASSDLSRLDGKGGTHGRWGSHAAGSMAQGDYGQTPGQLGSMSSGDFSAAVSSPPYADGTVHGGSGIDETKYADQSKSRPEWSPNNNHKAMQNYGSTPGNIGHMRAGDLDGVVSSPPYADAIDGSGEGPGARHDHKHHNADTAERLSSDNGYGSTPGNIGHMPAGDWDGVVSSPPFESTVNHDGGKADYLEAKKLYSDYSPTPGNVGNDSGDDFWSAARLIVEQTYAVLKPGGYVAWVCKDFVRKAQRVPFSDQWEQLCAAVGFEPVERIKAMLVEEHGDQMDIFGGVTARRKEKKSFFRRLAEKKGSPRIDWEDVVIMRKPL